MARYFFHLLNNIDAILDQDGSECDSLDAVTAKALRIARDLIADDVSNGLIDLSFRIEVADRAGDLVFSLPFDRAVIIVR